uniref:Uncharacterized protein n=1 Tax=Arundo donax TaxID=35708 RepID=A0A0A9EQE5_ARUDO
MKPQSPLRRMALLSSHLTRGKKPPTTCCPSTSLDSLRSSNQVPQYSSGNTCSLAVRLLQFGWRFLKLKEMMWFV